MAFPGIAFPQLVVLDVAKAAIAALLDDSPERTLAGQVVASLKPRDRDAFMNALRTRPGKARLAFAQEVQEDWQVVVMMTSTRPLKVTTGMDRQTEEDPIGIAQLATALPTTEDNVALELDDIPDDLPTDGRVYVGEELALYHRDGDTLTLTYRGVDSSTATPHDVGEAVTFHNLINRTGWDEVCAVRCDVLGTNPLLGIVLIAVIKACLLRSLVAFEAAGVTLMGADESALTPRPISWPAQLLHTTLSLEFQRAFTVPEQVEILTGIDAGTTVEGV